MVTITIRSPEAPGAAGRLELLEDRHAVQLDPEGGLPFRDETVDEVHLVHVLEKVHDIPGLLRELWRVSKEGTLVYATVPHATSAYTPWLEVTRRRPFTVEAFDRLGGWTDATFDLDVAEIHLTAQRGAVHPLRRAAQRVIEPLANRNRTAQYRCERWWGQWIGFDELYVIIRAVKDVRELRRREIGHHMLTASDPPRVASVELI